MGNKYPSLPLADLVTIHDTKRKPITKSKRVTGIYPYYGASGITDYVEGYVFDGLYVLLAEDGDNLRTRNTPIAFTAKGKFWVNNHAHVLKGVDDLDTQYICYALQHAEIDSYISGSTRPKITQGDLKKIPVTAPPLRVRHQIARLVNDFDQKIELNQQTNQTLEKMAQTLFKSWFVDFDPVFDNLLAKADFNLANLENTLPEQLFKKAKARLSAINASEIKNADNIKASLTALAQSLSPHSGAEIDATSASILPQHTNHDHFPSEFEHNEQLGWIPKGWEASNVGKEFDVTMGQSPPGSTYNEDKEGIPFFQGKTDFGFRFPSNRIYCTAPKRLANKNDTLVSVRAPVGTINLAASYCAIGRGLAAVRHKSGSISFTYYAMNNLSKNFEVFEGEGTVFGSINQKDFNGLPQISHPPELVSIFNSLCAGWDKKIELTSLQVNGLTKLRDTLLPKLISGELELLTNTVQTEEVF